MASTNDLAERYVKHCRSNAERANKEWIDIEAAGEEAMRQATVRGDDYMSWLDTQTDVDLPEHARRGAEAADRIGCGYSTQAGEMPTQAEVDIRLQRAADAVRRSGPTLRAEKLDELIAIALFARLLAGGGQ